MDKTDLFLIMMLLANSRTTYRELASKIGLSVNAVHKRIQGLVQSGIIRTFSASLDIGMLKALTIIIFGKCQDCTVEEVLKRAQKNDAIYWISAAGGDFVYVGAHIRSISDLEPLVEYVRDELCIAEPTVGIENVQQHVCPEKELTALDYQIMRSLQKNSRKQIVDIAEELHISAKTVQRKLSNMEQNRMIKFSLE